MLLIDDDDNEPGQSLIIIGIVLYSILICIGVVSLRFILKNVNRYRIMFIICYMASSISGLVHCLCNSSQLGKIGFDVYLLINRTLELAMLVFVLFYMMRYFSEYIVNMKKKKVRHYIYCCIIVYAAYFFLVVIGLLRETIRDHFRFTEIFYVISNALISVFCIMACKHIIYKLKHIFSDVCSSMRVEVAKNIALLVTNTFLLLVVLIVRIITSLYIYYTDHITTTAVNGIFLILPAVFNLILLTLVKDYSARTRQHSRHRWFGRKAMCLIDSSSNTTGCECQFSPSSSPTEPYLKYKYDETVSNRSLVGTGQGDTSLRSLFSSSGKIHQPAPSMTNLNDTQAEVTGDEVSSEEDFGLNPENMAFAMGTQPPSEDRQTSPSEMTITSSPTESPVEESTRETTGLLVQDRCGKPLECSVSFAVFVRLSHPSKLLSRCRNIFVQCSYRYIDEDMSIPKDYTNCGETENVPIMTCAKGFMFNCCICVPIPMVRERMSSITPTSLLQDFLSSHSTPTIYSHPITDVELKFEVIGTNIVDNHTYTKYKYNRLLFTEIFSLNTILNSRNALLVVNREKTCSSPPRPHSVQSQIPPGSYPLFNESPKGSGMTESHIMHLQRSDGDQNDSRQTNVESFQSLGGSMIFPSEGGIAISSEMPMGWPPLVDRDSFSNGVSSHPVIDVANLDFDQIPDFVETIPGERFASCPGTIMLQPNASPTTLTYQTLQHQFNYEDANDIHYSTPGTVGLRDSIGSEPMEALSLADLSMSLPPNGMNSDRTRYRVDKRENRYCYVFGCYVVAIRGRLEGRFFQKEYIFDKSGDEGRGVFCPSMSTPPGMYLNHVCEVMNETDFSFDIPASYTHFTERLWSHELEDFKALYMQQQTLAESRLRRHEFNTMDELLKESRDFVQSQRFYENAINIAQSHLDMLNKNDHSVDKRVRRFTFKPSTMKKVEEAAMLPTNLHINDIVIQRRNMMSCDSLTSLFQSLLRPRVPAYSMLSCGTPNAYFYKFHCGGLFTLIHDLNERNTKRYLRSESGLRSSLQIRERFDVATSQALSILVTSFVNDLRHMVLSLNSSIDDNHIFQQWLTSGYPIMFSSLLSMYSKEKAMILDSLVAIESLRAVRFKLVIRRCSKFGITYNSEMKVINHQLVIPITMYCTLQHLHLQEYHILKEHKLQGAMISVVPFFFTMGVDVSQTITDLISVHNVAIEKHINQLCYRDLVNYANCLLHGTQPANQLNDLYNAPDSRAGNTINLQRLIHYIMTNYNCYEEVNLDFNCDNGDFSEEMSNVRRVLRENSIKSVDLIQSYLMVGERLHAGIVVMCKSGKDRTGMLITLRETRILESSHIVNKSSFDAYLDLIRGYGTRIKNTEKNTGKAQYMFNSIQNTFLPKQFKAPKCTRGHGIT